ncbi:hypothetical protein [Hymenobacter terricola]|uniref:hypothetical protein n=1 Tax=Hymenobacter terricola TaxID=2819236 RepID=UPI001B3093B5|nr:hypothetical protein [Hymenobacter terricola]
MEHPFAPTVTELKALRAKLNYLTYQALFGKKLEDRQEATAQAMAMHDKIEAALTTAWNTATIVTDFVRSPQSYGGLFDTLTQFIDLVEAPVGASATQKSPGCTAMPHIPRRH